MTSFAGTAGLGVLWRLGSASTFNLLAFALTAPVLAVLLQQRGHSTATIGAFAMIPFLLIGVLIPVVPRMLARWGVVRVYRWGALGELLGALGYALGDGLLIWSASSVLTGVGAAALWNATEALLASEAPADKRGRVMGLYQTSLGAALAVGPFLPALLAIPARPALWLGAVLVGVCCAIALTVPPLPSAEPRTQGRGGTWHAVRTVPLLAFLAFAGGLFEAGQSSVSAAYASATGWSLSAAASVAGAIGVGSFLCQYPAGWLADHFPLRSVFRCAALALLAASIGIAFVETSPWLLWACGLVWGGVGGALYTLSMVQVAHVFTGRPTAGGAAAMISAYTLGGTLGPLASGAALEWAGTAGLAAALAAAALAGLLCAPGAARST